MGDEHGVASAHKGGLEVGEKFGLPEGDGVVGGGGKAVEGGGRGVDGVDVVPDGGGADATEGGDDPREEDSVLSGTRRGLFANRRSAVDLVLEAASSAHDLANPSEKFVLNPAPTAIFSLNAAPPHLEIIAM